MELKLMDKCLIGLEKEDLFRLYKQGNMYAYSLLLECYSESLKQLIYEALEKRGVKDVNDYDIEDISQEVFLELISIIEYIPLEEPESLSRFQRLILKNKINSFLEKRLAEKELLIGLVGLGDHTRFSGESINSNEVFR